MKRIDWAKRRLKTPIGKRIISDRRLRTLRSQRNHRRILTREDGMETMRRRLLIYTALTMFTGISPFAVMAYYEPISSIVYRTPEWFGIILTGSLFVICTPIWFSLIGRLRHTVKAVHDAQTRSRERAERI